MRFYIFAKKRESMRTGQFLYSSFVIIKHTITQNLKVFAAVARTMLLHLTNSFEKNSWYCSGTVSVIAADIVGTFRKTSADRNSRSGRRIPKPTVRLI